jgi:uncharacterized protein YegL
VTDGFSPRVNEDNPDPRIACVLMLDTSGSMAGDPIDELNEGFRLFSEEVSSDDLAKKRAEIAVICFGGTARVEIPFTEGRDLQPRRFAAGGSTPMGEAVNLAVDQLTGRKVAYRKAGLEYFRPWLFILTDGEPTDIATFPGAALRLREAEEARGVSVFPIGVGSRANMSRLAELSAVRGPVKLKGLHFGEFFAWLSASLRSASASNASGSSDSAIAHAEATEQIPLPPPGWTQA